MQRALKLLACMSLLATGRAAAQDIASLPVSARVRITIADSTRQWWLLPRAQSVIGTVARATGDTLWLHIAGPDTMRVPRVALRRLEMSRGVSRARSALEQGLSLGLLSVLILHSNSDDPPPIGRALGAGAIGAAAGAALGAWRPYERWRRVR
jgi:hypothetical protein